MKLLPEDRLIWSPLHYEFSILSAICFLVYHNSNSELQLEICGDSAWFHCEIRRIINGEPEK